MNDTGARAAALTPTRPTSARDILIAGAGVWVSRGALSGFVASVAIGGHACMTWYYGGGIVVLFLLPPVGLVVGAILASVLGAVWALFKAGYRWRALIVLLLASAVPGLLAVIVHLRGVREQVRRHLNLAVSQGSAVDLREALTHRVTRYVARDELDVLFACAGLKPRGEVLDALVAQDPRGTHGAALCAAAQTANPVMFRLLLDRGFTVNDAHRADGMACAPLRELVRTQTPAGCSYEEQFGYPNAPNDCANRVEVAELLLAAGASSEGLQDLLIGHRCEALTALLARR